MKRLSYSLLAMALLLAGCTPSPEKQAQPLLAEIRAHIDSTRYETALILIDSLHRTYPKALQQRKEAQALWQQVRHAKAKRDSAFIAPQLDSLRLREEALWQLMSTEKSPLVPDHSITRYRGYDPSGREGQYLDAYINNQGLLELVVSTAGVRPLKSTNITLREELSDTFVTAPPLPYDGGNNYRYKSEGVHYERLTYVGPDAEALAQFLSTGGEQARFVVEVSGEDGGVRKFRLASQERLALRHLYELTHLRHVKEQLLRDQALAHKILSGSLQAPSQPSQH